MSKKINATLWNTKTNLHRIIYVDDELGCSYYFTGNQCSTLKLTDTTIAIDDVKTSYCGLYQSICHVIILTSKSIIVDCCEKVCSVGVRSLTVTADPEILRLNYTIVWM